MKTASSRNLAALLLLPFAAHAQTAEPADAKSVVPAVTYSSAFDKKKAEANTTTPDRLWRQANDRVRDGGAMDSSAMPASMPAADGSGHEAHHHNHGE